MSRTTFPDKSLLESLLATIPSPAVVADPKGRILLFSEAAEAVFGYSTSEARRELLVQDLFVSADVVPGVLETLGEAPDRRLRGRRVRLRAQDGESIPAQLSARWVLGDGGEPVAWLAVLQDRREVADLETRLNNSTDRLITSEKRTTTMEIAGAAAHHLNQPLTSIMGSIELLANRRDLPPDVRRRVHKIYDQLERMARAVRELAQAQKHTVMPYIGDTSILDLSSDD